MSDHAKLAPRDSKPSLKLAVFDIDGTLRTARDPWIHLHEHLGFGEHAHKNKDLFYNGRISYQEWVDLDAAIWKGIHRDQMKEALLTNPLREGAAELLAWFRQRNISLVGISTGLDVFNSVIAEDFGFARMYCNQLLFDDTNRCTGLVNMHVREDGKGEILRQVLHDLSIESDSIVAFGDGTADIQLFENAGLSIAVALSKSAVREAADYCIESGSLELALKYITQKFSLPVKE